VDLFPYCAEMGLPSANFPPRRAASFMSSFPLPPEIEFPPRMVLGFDATRPSCAEQVLPFFREPWLVFFSFCEGNVPFPHAVSILRLFLCVHAAFPFFFFRLFPKTEITSLLSLHLYRDLSSVILHVSVFFSPSATLRAKLFFGFLFSEREASENLRFF